MTSFRIKDLEKTSGAGGWTWKIVFKDGLRQVAQRYCTNKTGRGLFAGLVPASENKVKGEDNFSLPSHHQGALKGIEDFFSSAEKKARDEQEKDMKNDTDNAKVS